MAAAEGNFDIVEYVLSLPPEDVTVSPETVSDLLATAVSGGCSTAIINKLKNRGYDVEGKNPPTSGAYKGTVLLQVLDSLMYERNLASNYETYERGIRSLLEAGANAAAQDVIESKSVGRRLPHWSWSLQQPPPPD